MVSADGEASVSLYSAAGALLNAASGNGSVKVSANGYRGAVIVKATSGNATVTKKVMLK